jgi:hypothetical protein
MRRGTLLLLPQPQQLLLEHQLVLPGSEVCMLK